MSLHIQSTGAASAPTIVFLHGLGVSSWMWTEQVAELSRDYHCVTIDLPGNGESYRETWHSLADTAAQVAAVIREVAANGKAHVVGLSLGGYVTLKLLADHPDVVETALISGVSAGPLTPEWLIKGMVAITVPLLKWGPYVNLMATVMQLPKEARALYRQDSRRLATATSRRIYDEVMYFSLPPELTKRSQRLLAAVGELEVKTLKDNLKHFPEHMPTCTAVMVPKAHHGWNGEFPQLFTDMVRAWVEGQPLPEELERVGVVV